MKKRFNSNTHGQLELVYDGKGGRTQSPGRKVLEHAGWWFAQVRRAVERSTIQTPVAPRRVRQSELHWAA